VTDAPRSTPSGRRGGLERVADCFKPREIALAQFAADEAKYQTAYEEARR
jgi:hypothetical protein